jgi:hypothetical protein
MAIAKRIAVLALLACAALIAWHPWQAAFAIGVHPYPAGTPWTYQLWSGFIPGLAIASLLSALAAHLRMMNCHVENCWRIGRYPVANSQYKVCRRHHPDVTVRQGKITHAHIIREHEKCAGLS